MTQLFPQGVKGLADSKWSGVLGSAYRLVGLDFHSKPGLIRVAQALAKDSSTTIDGLCKVGLPVSDGSKLWFSSESGKIWRESSGTYTLIHTIDTNADFLGDTISSTLSTSSNFNIRGLRVLPSGSAFPVLAASTSEFISGSATTLTKAITVPTGSNRVLIVYAYNYGATAPISATYGGSAMTLLTTGSYSGGGTSVAWTLFYIIAPIETTANIVVTWAAGTVDRGLIATSWTGAHQTTPVDGSVNSVGTGVTAVALDIPSSGENQIRLAFCTGEGVSSLPTFTHASTQTQILSQTLGANTFSFAVYVGDLGGEICLSAEEHGDYIFFTTEKLLFRIAVADIGSTWSIASTYGVFVNGDDTYHSMTKQNNELFIGDDIVIAKVGSVADSYLFTAETAFNIQAPEKIVSLAPFDNDVIVGTLNVSKGRALRWDTVSDSWSAEDDTPEGGVFAFIRDDNYLYAVVGNFGSLMFYNGEKLERYLRIPGDYSPTKKLKINPHAVAFHLGIPLFGVSNSTGNPALEGVYSLGSYSKDYLKILDLTYPISSGEFTGMEIGAIVVDGADLYVAWKGASTQGIDKLNWSAKYALAYFETMQLVDLNSRGFLKTLKEFRANYVSLPTNTDIVLKYDANYTGSYTTLTSVKDTKVLQKKSNKSIPNVGALQLRGEFTVSSNDAPEVEGYEYFFSNQKVRP